MAIENYLSLDFNTFIEEAKKILSESDTFKDYNYEGSNISVLIELLAYHMDLNTYYQNQIAKNLFIDTSTIYNTTHRIANLIGYRAKGYIAAYAEVTITIDGEWVNENDQIFVPKYTKFATEDGIDFVTTKDKIVRVYPYTSGDFSFDVGLKQGSLDRQEFDGTDLIDYQYFLPTRKYDHDDNRLNNEISSRVYVNDTEWVKTDAFYNNMSEYQTKENVFLLNFTKNRQYAIEFSQSLNWPRKTDLVTVDLIETLGSGGSVGKNEINTIDEEKIVNITSGQTIPLDGISVINEESSRGGVDPQTIEDLKEQSRTNINSQFRCVTKYDYRNFLELRESIDAANVWGEKEIAPSGNTQEYNKMYISVIPYEWGSSTITRELSTWNAAEDVNVDIYNTVQYSESFKKDISEYIEPRKLMNLFEIFELPDLVYFYFEIGLKLKRTYDINNVANDVKNKLLYYFHSTNREFGEVIDFREVEEYILDMSNVSTTDNFRRVAGIRYLTFREVETNHVINNYLSDSYPQYYDITAFDDYIDNTLRPVKLGQNQFPQITRDSIIIRDEG